MVGCRPTHEMLLPLSGGGGFEPLTVRLCANDDCDEFRLDEPRVEHDQNLPEGNEKAFVIAAVSCQTDSCELYVNWQLAASIAGVGDRFEVTATSDADDVRAHVVEVATAYERTFPNGRACNPYGCMTVSEVTSE
ncbi:MAG TPA: hypothetical protein VM686_30790 [Polyangiaceae bacterium]|nr:hypothetical protein [Polyangiaceae bacterium]